MVQEEWIQLKMKFLWGYNVKIIFYCGAGRSFGGGDSTRGDFSWWRVGMSKFLSGGGTASHLPSRENLGLHSPTIPQISCNLFSWSFCYLFSWRTNSGLFISSSFLLLLSFLSSSLKVSWIAGAVFTLFSHWFWVWYCCWRCWYK